MARELDHIALANRNHELLKHLLESPERFPEWTATVSFYKAVQIVEASFVHALGHGTTSHPERLRRLKHERKYQHVYRHYRPLWVASTVARYLEDHENSKGYRRFVDYMTPKQVVDELVNHCLKQIEGSVAKSGFLSPEGIQRLERL